MSPQSDLGGWSKLSRLDGRQREAYEAVEIEGLPPQEAAKALRVQPSTLRTHLQRARDKVESNR